jgi:hypothetical protein
MADKEPETFEEFSAVIKAEFESGDHPEAVLRMVWVCAMHRWQLPEWAKNGFDAVYRLGYEGRLRSWDDAFGKPFPEQQARWSKTRSRRVEVWAKVHDYALQGEPITNDLFERVDRDLGVGSYTTVKELYYEVQAAYVSAQSDARSESTK